MGTARLRSTFVIAQVALSFVLLVGAGLFIRTLIHAYAVDLGYNVDRIVGLYGVMALTVKQRTREVGLRLAIGATPAEIMRLIVARGVRLIAVGFALGLAGAAAGVRLVRAQLFGVETTDPLTWLGVGLLLGVVGLLACGIPARRAMKVAPAAVLRSL